MRTVGIICEYNPFHTGHAYQLQAARRDTEASLAVAVMSEHVTQRGEFAIADGYVRAECAVRAGIDLVIALPYPYSASSAEYFATSAVRILNALDIDCLHFGSECGNIRRLQTAAGYLYSPDFIDAVTALQSEYPMRGIMDCQASIYQQRYRESLPGGSNDLLGIAYLHALQLTNSRMSPFTLRRLGQDYKDDKEPCTTHHPSASALRAVWSTNGLQALRPHLPIKVFETLLRAEQEHCAPMSMHAIETAILAYYRLSDPDELALYEGLSDGLSHRLCRAAKQATDLSTMLALTATRHYTDARVRRSVLYGICGIRTEDVTAPPAYVRLLAANDKGRSYLASIRRKCPLPIVTKPTDVPITPQAMRQRAIEQRLEALLSLAYPIPRVGGDLVRRVPWMQLTEK